MSRPALLALLLLAGCASAMTRPTHMTENEISIQYDTLGSGLDKARALAEKHCNGPVELVGQWDMIGTRGATFRCVK